MNTEIGEQKGDTEVTATSNKREDRNRGRICKVCIRCGSMQYSNGAKKCYHCGRKTFVSPKEYEAKMKIRSKSGMLDKVVFEKLFENPATGFESNAIGIIEQEIKVLTEEFNSMEDRRTQILGAIERLELAKKALRG